MKERSQRIITLKINGKHHEIGIGNSELDMPESETLADTLRNRFGLTGLKVGCDQGVCGACTVIRDKKAIASCMTLTIECDGADILTIEGLADSEGNLSGLQEAFLEKCGFQCGFCTSGVIMTANALLLEQPDPSESEVREALAGNYCRCGTYYSAVDSVMTYVEKGK